MYIYNYIYIYLYVSIIHYVDQGFVWFGNASASASLAFASSAAFLSAWPTQKHQNSSKRNNKTCTKR